MKLPIDRVCFPLPNFRRVAGHGQVAGRGPKFTRDKHPE